MIAAVGPGGGARRHRAAEHDLKRGCLAAPFPLPEPWITEPSWIFPSGHVMGSLVAYGFLAYLLTRITPAYFPRRTALALLSGLVLLIGFSRIYLGVHFLSDVIGGYAAAAVWLTFCILMTHRTQVRVSRIPNPAWPEAPAGMTSNGALNVHNEIETLTSARRNQRFAARRVRGKVQHPARFR